MWDKERRRKRRKIRMKRRMGEEEKREKGRGRGGGERRRRRGDVVNHVCKMPGLAVCCHLGVLRVPLNMSVVDRGRFRFLS